VLAFCLGVGGLVLGWVLWHWGNLFTQDDEGCDSVGEGEQLA
jgi:hypothetical protein